MAGREDRRRVHYLCIPSESRQSQKHSKLVSPIVGSISLPLHHLGTVLVLVALLLCC